MTAKTPIYGLEYLVQGEPVRLTRAAMEANAKTTEAALARGGVAPPAAQDLVQVAGRVSALEALALPARWLAFTNGWSNFASSFAAAQVWTDFRSVHVQGLVKPPAALAAAATSNICQLHAGYRPPPGAGIQPTAQTANGTQPVRIDVTPDGILQLTASGAIAAGSYVTLNMTFSRYLAT